MSSTNKGTDRDNTAAKDMSKTLAKGLTFGAILAILAGAYCAVLAFPGEVVRLGTAWASMMLFIAWVILPSWARLGWIGSGLATLIGLTIAISLVGAVPVMLVIWAILAVWLANAIINECYAGG